MKNINRLRVYIKNPRIPLLVFLEHCGHCIPDKKYIEIRWRIRNGSRLNLDNPQTFNEKLQWLKLYDHKPEYALLADKYEVKKIVAGKIGEQYVVPCLGVWDNPDDVDIARLPNQFVIKCNHDSGGNMGICKDKSKFDISHFKSILWKSYSRDYFWAGRDKQYRDIKKKVFAEKFLNDGREGGLQDYKFWCFNGVPQYMYVTNKGNQVYENFYDMDFNPVMIDHGFPRFQPEYDKPSAFDEMKSLASQLSQGHPFVRIDFYYVDGHVFFGEYTFFDWGGFKKFGGEWDIRLGRLIEIPSLR